MVGIGLIGTGFMGKCHAIAWNAVGTVFPDVERPRLVHLGEVNDELARRKAGEFGFAKGSGDWRAVVNDPEVDIVSLTTPNQFHPEMAIAILEAGKHLWCEKPMAPSFAEAEAMALAARKSGKVAALGYNYIQNPAIRHIGQLLDEKIIGDVNLVRIEMDEDFMADPDALFFWKHEATSGYGALDDFAVHPLSLIRVLFGRVGRVMCDMAKPYADRKTTSGTRRSVETYDIGQYEIIIPISSQYGMTVPGWKSAVVRSYRGIRSDRMLRPVRWIAASARRKPLAPFRGCFSPCAFGHRRGVFRRRRRSAPWPAPSLPRASGSRRNRPRPPRTRPWRTGQAARTNCR